MVAFAKVVTRSLVLGTFSIGFLSEGACNPRDPAPTVLASPDDGPATEASFVETSGRALTEYMTRAEWSAGGSRGGAAARHSRSVVPIVSPTWKPGEPVPMWVTGAAQHGPMPSWGSNLAERERAEKAWAAALTAALAKGPIRGKVIDRGGRKPSSGRGESAETLAIADCASKHGVHTQPRAPVIAWNP